MGKIGLAFRAFFKVLMNRQVAEEVESLFRHNGVTKSDAPRIQEVPQTPAQSAKSVEKVPARSDALTLLATLQREARFLDLVQEPLAGFSDAEVGAAARDVLRNCQSVVSRMFEIQPVLTQEERTPIEIPTGFNAAEFRLTGNVRGEPPFRGTVEHRGWKATKCQVPEWSGGTGAAMILAPAEVEVK